MIRKTPYQKSQDKITKLWLAEEELRKICEHPKEYVQIFSRTIENDGFGIQKKLNHKCHWCGKTWSVIE